MKLVAFNVDFQEIDFDIMALGDFIDGYKVDLGLFEEVTVLVKLALRSLELS